MEDFADWLRSVRKAAGLSQGELASACKAIDENCLVHQPRISEWEGGKGLPDLRQVGLVAIALRLSVESLEEGLLLLRGASFRDLPVPGHGPSPVEPSYEDAPTELDIYDPVSVP